MANCITKHIPNTITCCNLISGCIAISEVFNVPVTGNYSKVVLWIVIGALFDFCDGLAARLLNAPSAIGKELDSLADVVTFGVAPAFLCFSMLRTIEFPVADAYIPYLAFLLAAFAAVRLAKFNIDTRQTTSFLGLPVPANAIFWCGAMTAITKWGSESAVYGYAILLGIIIFGLLMTSEIPMFSLKFKNLKWSDNRLRFIFLILSVVLLAFLRLPGGAAVIALYIILSVATSKKG